MAAARAYAIYCTIPSRGCARAGIVFQPGQAGYLLSETATVSGIPHAWHVVPAYDVDDFEPCWHDTLDAMTPRALRAGEFTPDEVAAEWPADRVPAGADRPTQTACSMEDDTGAAARAPELAEPMADMLAAPLADAAAALEREPLSTSADLDFFLGVTTAFSAVYGLALGGEEGDSLHRTLIYYILLRVTGDESTADRFSGFVDDYMRGGERPNAFLDGFGVGATAGRQCCHEDAPAAAQQTLFDGYTRALQSG